MVNWTLLWHFCAEQTSTRRNLHNLSNHLTLLSDVGRFVCAATWLPASFLLPCTLFWASQRKCDLCCLDKWRKSLSVRQRILPRTADLTDCLITFTASRFHRPQYSVARIRIKWTCDYVNWCGTCVGAREESTELLKAPQPQFAPNEQIANAAIVFAKVWTHTVPLCRATVRLDALPKTVCCHMLVDLKHNELMDGRTTGGFYCSSGSRRLI